MVTNFLLKKKTNPTPYSPISYFGKENNPPGQPCAFIIPYSNMKLLKTLNNLTTLKYPDATFKNCDYCTWLCQYNSQRDKMMSC
jgi:hypothetical protein